MSTQLIAHFFSLVSNLTISPPQQSPITPSYALSSNWTKQESQITELKWHLSQIIKKKKMQAYVKEFKEKKEIKKLQTSSVREKKMVTYTNQNY